MLAAERTPGILRPCRFWPKLPFIHRSFRKYVLRDLLHSLRARRVDPQFHYASYKQSQQWLALHETYSPSRTDAECAELYERAFRAAASASGSSPVRVVGLGCGGGQKDVRLLRTLAEQGRVASYAPCDVSLALVLTSMLAAQGAVPGAKCHPLMCDLGAASDLRQAFTPNFRTVPPPKSS